MQQLEPKKQTRWAPSLASIRNFSFARPNRVANEYEGAGGSSKSHGLAPVQEEETFNGVAARPRRLLRVSTDFLAGAFSSSFVKILQPRMEPGEKLQVNCMCCSGDGQLIITGGSISRPGRAPGTQVIRGSILVWRQSLQRHDLGQWHCWPIDAAEESIKAPVNCLSLKGEVLVSGHLANWESGKEERSRHFSGNVLSMVSFSRTRPVVSLPEILVWRIDTTSEDVHLRFEVSSGLGDVTAVMLLRPRRHGMGMRLATASSGKVTIWGGLDPESDAMSQLFAFSAHEDKISALAYLPRVYGDDESAPDLLATASNDKTVIIWEMHETKSRLIHTLTHPRELYGVSFFGGNDIDPDSEYIVACSHDNSMRLWHVGSGICVHEAVHDSPVTAVDFQSGGDMIATGTLSGQVSLFDAKTCARMRTNIGHEGPISSVKFLDLGDMLASASSDGTTRVWEVKSNSLSVYKLGERSLIMEGKGGHGKSVYSIDISNDCEMMATASRDHTVKLWNCSSGRFIASLEGHTNFVFMVAIHPKEPICATASHDHSIRIWSTVSGACLQMISRDDANADEELDALHTAEVSAVAFHPKGKIMASGSYDRSAILYTRDVPEDGEFGLSECAWVPYRVLTHHSDRIWDVTFSPCGTYLATAAWDNAVHVYRMDDNELSTEPVGVFYDADEVRDPQFSVLQCSAKVWSVAFRPGNDKDPIIITGAADQKIRVWERDIMFSWKMTATLEKHTDTVTGLSWHPRGHMFVSSSFDKTVRLWSRKIGTEGTTYEYVGLWSAYNWATMAVHWAKQPSRASGIETGATMIAIATLDGSTFLMDATDAGQQFVPYSRIQHILKQGEGSSRDMMIEMVSSFPHSLMSLGADSGVLLQAVITECDDLSLIKAMLDLYKANNVTPLMPYGPERRPLLASANTYHEVSAVVSCVVEMGEAGATMGAAAMSTGIGTCMILLLIERFPDQAVKLINHLGMVKANEVVYAANWNRRREMPTNGMITQDRGHPEIGQTRYPRSIWGPKRRSKSLSRRLQSLFFGSGGAEKLDVVALHSAFPYIAGLLPEEYLAEAPTKSLITSFTASHLEMSQNDYSTLEKSFLHLAYDSNEPQLFDTPLGRAVLNFKWEAYGKHILLAQAAIFCLQLISIVLQAYSLGRLNHAGGWVTSKSDRFQLELQAFVSAGFVLMFSLFQSVYEVLQIRAEGLAMYIGDLWSVLDVWVLLLGIVSGVLGLSQPPSRTVDHILSEWLPAVSSVTSFFAWMKVLYFLRAFPSTGGLVRMVVQIGYDMRYLLLVVTLTMFGAATSFFVLMAIEYSPGNSDSCGWEELEPMLDNPPMDHPASWSTTCEPPLSFWGMVLYAFAMMLGGFDLAFFDSLDSFRVLGKLLFVVYMMFQMILLLNLLIALMGDSYEKVQEKANTEALRERAGLLVEIELVMGKRHLTRKNYCPRWLHALVPKETTQGFNSRRAREWAGITGTLRKDLETQVAQLKSVVADQLEASNEKVRQALAKKIADSMKELATEMRAAMDIQTAALRESSGHETPIKPQHARRQASLAQHRRTVVRRKSILGVIADSYGTAASEASRSVRDAVSEPNTSISGVAEQATISRSSNE